MWADSLLRAEQLHLIRLAGWGALSTLAGTLVWALLLRRASSAPLLRQFGAVTAVSGALVLAMAAAWWTRLGIRDHDGAVALDRFLWLSVGVDAGLVVAGATLAGAGWRLARRLGPVGAGMAVVVQGAALAVLDLALAGQVVR